MYLVINLGLKSIRGILFNGIGKKKFQVNYKIKTKIIGQFVEQNPIEYRFLFFKILKELNKKNLTKKINYISTTTSANCLMLIGKKGNLCSNVITVLDRRCERLSKDINKNSKFRFKSEMQLLKVLWYKKNKPKIFKKSKYWINNGDYLNFLLTDKIFTDSLNYQKFEFKNKKFTNDFLKKNKLDKNCIPKKFSIGTKFKLSDNIKKKYNFNDNTKFVLTTYDAICATIGSSDLKNKNGNISEVSGTVTSVRLMSKKKPKNKSKLNLSYIPLIDRYFLGGSNNLGGGILVWYKNFLHNRVSLENFNKIYKHKKNETNMFFLPYLFGDRYLGIEKSSQGLLYGIGASTNLNDITRAVFESTALTSKIFIEDIQKQGNLIKSISLSGGLSKLNFINQIKNEIYRKKILLCKEHESTSLGSFILMLVATKKIPLESLSRVIKFKTLNLKYLHSKAQNDTKFYKFKELVNFLKHYLSNKKFLPDHQKIKIYKNL